MNYLAHLFLSGDDDEDLLFGNFIADHVKGSDLSAYSLPIQAGIRFHRMIDAYTDSHIETAAGKELLYPYTGKYASVAMDIILDHFLARRWSEFHHEDLAHYSARIYSILDDRIELMPEKTLFMYTYMKSDNWLMGYALIPGIERALKGLSRRTSDPSKLAASVLALREHYQALEEVFNLFFPQLIDYTTMIRKT